MVSHSYGGGVAEQVLLDFPKYIKHNIFISPTLSPNLQGAKWYNKVVRRTKFLFPRAIKSSNIEMLGLQESLLINEKRLADINTPITYFQGNKDWLVPKETVEYFKERVKSDKVKYIIMPEESHFILWTHPDKVLSELFKLIEI